MNIFFKGIDIHRHILLSQADLSGLSSIEEASDILQSYGFAVTPKPDPHFFIEKANAVKSQIVFKRGAHPNSTLEMDCSSFVTNIFEYFGITLPRRSIQIYEKYKNHKIKDLDYLDIVFFDGAHNRRSYDGTIVGHIAIHVGDNKIMHMTRTKGLIIEEIETFKEWAGRKITAQCRIFWPNHSILFTAPKDRYIETPNDLYWIIYDIKNGIIKKKEQ